MGRTLVLGIGNLIMTDDGIGVRVVHELTRRYQFPAEVTVLDGGTLGLDLLPYLEEVARLLIIDAVMVGEPPGTVVRMTGDQIPAVFATKLSPHQMGLQDLLAVAELLGHRPADMVLLGVQPEDIELGDGLSPSVAVTLEPIIASSLAVLAAWGIVPHAKTSP